MSPIRNQLKLEQKGDQNFDEREDQVKRYKNYRSGLQDWIRITQNPVTNNSEGYRCKTPKEMEKKVSLNLERAGEAN